MREVRMTLSLLVFALFVAGCGSKVVRVTGQVVENGQPAPLTDGECIQVDLVTVDAAGKLPLSIMTFVKPDGSFAADQNDGSGRGLPPGKYLVRLNRETTVVKKTVNAKLFKEGTSVEVAAGHPVRLTIDLATGTISPQEN
jgi:hypothetical protein